MDARFELRSEPASKPAARATRPKAPPRTRRPSKAEIDRDRRARIASLTFAHASPEETHFRHSHWTARREKIRTTLFKSGASELQIKNWDNCGSACQILYSPSTGTVRLAANYCKCRHCQPCARAKANRIARNLKSKLQSREVEQLHRDGNAERFVTFTLRHRNDRLAPLIAKLFAAFKKFRKDPAWSKTQLGGAAILEVKYTAAGWHPHLHVITTGRYVDVRDLSAAWLRSTGDSSNVDIRRMDRGADACHYVCKYMTKGVSSEVWDDDSLAQEYICAMRGTRCANTFGNWRGWRLTKPTSDVTDWKPLCTLQELLRRAQHGELAAQGILMQLRPGRLDQQPDETGRPPP